MQEPRTSIGAEARYEYVYHVVVLLASLAVIVLALVLRVRDDRVLLPLWDIPLPESCWYKRVTGFGCPGCGLTRCAISLVHGEFLQAWHFNPGGYLFFALIVGQFPYRIAQIWRISRGFVSWRPTAATSVLVFILAAILLIQWAVRWCVVSS